MKIGEYEKKKGKRMDKKAGLISPKQLVLVLGLAVAAMALAWPVERIGPGSGSTCDGCRRTAVLARVASDLAYYQEHGDVLAGSTQSRLVEALTTPCFHLQDRALSGGIPEYFFAVEFSRSGAGAKASGTRLSIELFYNGEPQESVFKISTDSPIEDYSSHVNRMYQNRDAAINKVKPIDEILRNFERRPESCKIQIEGGEEISPFGEVEVTISDFRDASGRPSREFNRIIVGAERGIIRGGDDILEDPRRQAFRIGDGVVKLRYQAPVECQTGQDEIQVYSSCEILDPGKQPMERTKADRKIGGKQVKLNCPEGVLTISYTYRGDEEYKHAVIDIGLGRLDFSVPFGDTGNNADYHPVLYMKIREAEAFKRGMTGSGFRFFPMVEQTTHYMIISDPKTRKVAGVLMFNNLLMFKWTDGKDGYMDQDCASNVAEPTGGDGTFVTSGQCSDGGGSIKWTLRRFR